MVDVVVTDDQARDILARSDTVRICDPRGRVLYTIAARPADVPDDIADMRRALASDQPRYTTAQVLDHLRSLSNQ